MQKTSKRLYILIFTVVAVGICALVSIILLINKSDSPDTYPEVDIYYFESEDVEYKLSINRNNRFSFNDGVDKTGTYITQSDGSLSFTFDNTKYGQGFATVLNNTLTFSYAGKEILFYREISFSVFFDTCGGNLIPPITVLNGKSFTSATPNKENFVFMGWYTDADYNTQFVMGQSIITDNTVLYARWTEEEKTSVEYTVKFVGADLPDMTVMDGKLPILPTPEREGYTFGGWWISPSDSIDNLSIKCNSGDPIGKDITLYALWIKNTNVEKLASPTLQINENRISWNEVTGAVSYEIKITSPDSTVVFCEILEQTHKDFTFELAGTYIIELVAIAEKSDNNSEKTVKYYISEFSESEVGILEFVESDDGTYSVRSSDGIDKITDLVIPKTYNGKAVNSILANAFLDSLSLESVLIPSTVTFIGDFAFSGCKNLRDIYFENRSMPIEFGASVFSDCIGLRSVYLPRSFDFFDAAIFDKCTSITEIIVDEENTALASIDGVLYNADLTEVIYCPRTKTLDFSLLPETITKIGAYSFKNNRNILKVELPSSILVIGEFAFSNTELVGIDIPSSVTYIGDGAFANCTSLSYVHISEGISPLTLGTQFDCDTGTLSGVFEGCENLSLVTLSSRVFSIGARTFYNLKALSTFEIPSGSILSIIGDYAFFNDYKISSLNLPEGLLSIGAHAFENMNNRSFTSVVIPSSVTYIGEYAFSNCTKLSSVEFKEGFENLVIANGAFSYCSSIKNITLPSRLISGGTTPTLFYTVFSHCKRLENINVSEDSNNFLSIQGVLYERDEKRNATALVLCPPAKTGAVSVPSSVTLVRRGAFHNTKITEVYFDDLVTLDSLSQLTVGEPLLNSDATEALPVFSGDSLRKIRFPIQLKRVSSYAIFCVLTKDFNIEFSENSKDVEILSYAISGNTGLSGRLVLPPLSLLGDKAFYGCTSVFTVEFLSGSTLKEIGEYAFSSERATNIEAVLNLPSSVKTIKCGAFANSPRLSRFEFEEKSSLVTIGDYAFSGSGLTSFVFPDSTSFLGSGVFSESPNLESITLSSNIQSIISTTGESSFSKLPVLSNIIIPDDNEWLKLFDGALYSGDMATLVLILPGVDFSEENFVIPNSVTKIEKGAFYNFNGAALIIPEGVSTLDFDTFSSLNSLKEIIILSDIEEIPEGLFRGLSKLERVVLPSTVRIIGDRAFSDCESLFDLTISSNIEYIGNYAFSSCKNVTSISFGKELTYIGAYAFDGCESLKSIVFDENSQITFGTDNKGGCGIFRNTKQLESITLPNGIIELGESLFEGSGLEDITIPESVRSIGNSAFKGCTALEKITLPQETESLLAYAFMNCVSLTTLNIPESLTEIKGNPFINCPSLILDFDERNTSFVFEDGALYNFDKTLLIVYTNKKESLTLPKTVEAFAEGAFSASNIKTFVFPEGLKTVPGMLFMYAKSLEEIVIPETVLSIGERAFFGCTSLQSVKISSKVEYISDYAFSGCVSLNEVSFDDRDDELKFGTRVFQNCISLCEIELPSSIKALAPYMFENTGFTSFDFPEHILDANIEGLFMNCKILETFSFHDSIESPLGAYFFKNCTSLKSVELGSVKEFGTPLKIDSAVGKFYATDSLSGAFMGCSSLFAIDLSNVSVIGAYAFYGCSSLNQIIFPKEKLDLIGDYAFFGCTSLERVDLRGIYLVSDEIDIMALGTCVFKGCSALREISFEMPINELREGIFSDCTSLKTVEFLSSISYMGYGESPFEGMNGSTIVKFSAPIYSAVNLPLIFEYYVFVSKDGSYESLSDNHTWYREADCIILSCDGKVLMPDGSVIELDKHPGYRENKR